MLARCRRRGRRVGDRGEVPTRDGEEVDDIELRGGDRVVALARTSWRSSTVAQRVAFVVVVDDGEATPRPLDTRMSSVRRRDATGGDLVVDEMHWTLEMGVARGDGGGGGGAAVEINGDFTFVIRCFKINFKNISCRDSLGGRIKHSPGATSVLVQ